MSLHNALEFLKNSPHITRLSGIVRGIEKESLRVDKKGYLAASEHPLSLGAALTHPSITTDFSEALLEFITAPSASLADVLNELEEIHRFTYQEIKNELLWVSSMPCQLRSDSEIPIANYGNSNIGTMKKIYRLGLGHRYGRAMQTIAGIHYNFSLPDDFWQLLQEYKKSKQPLQAFKSAEYFALIRNFRRYSWLLIYLLGAAPAVCKSFVAGRSHQLEPVGSDTHSLFTPYATSLRMGDLGYQSNAQSSLCISYNSLEQYISSLRDALGEPFARYDEIGLKDQQGNYKQLNTHLLQIENEFYSAIRPKRTALEGETPLQALENKGVEYIEVRCLDVNPLIPCGIDDTTVRFIDVFLLFCLLSESPAIDAEEDSQIPANLMRTVYNGRNPQLGLTDQGNDRALYEWGCELLASMRAIADVLDQAHTNASADNSFQRSLAIMQSRMENPQDTPSAMLLNEMRENNETYFALAMRRTLQQRDHFLSRPLDSKTQRKYRDIAEQSHRDQAAIEGADNQSFEAFLDDYWQRSIQ
jgi:glutamate--cysteine ligase